MVHVRRVFYSMAADLSISLHKHSYVHICEHHALYTPLGKGWRGGMECTDTALG